MKTKETGSYEPKPESSMRMDAERKPSGYRWTSDPSVKVSFRTGGQVVEGPVLWPYW